MSTETALYLTHAQARRVLTEKRIEMLQVIGEREPASIRHLAEIIDRNPSTVTDDVNMLYDMGVIDFAVEGRSKAPRLASGNICVDPLVQNGEVML